MKPLDPRLLPHLAPARIPLAGAVLASVVSGVLVIAQAFAVAALIVGVLGGSGLSTGEAPGDWSAARDAAVALAVIVAARALTGWLVDILSAAATERVTRSLRRRVLEAALALGPFELSRRRSGELAVLSTRGVAAVDPYLTRYLPALFLAATVPVLTVLAIASQDLLSAVVVVCTLPLVPVFAVLVGMATRDRADRQWRAMAALSGHFVDVMRGLPTLVAHRRAAAQSASIRAITDRYRRATNDTLKLAFASSAVLELVATISVALVAVVVGLRLSAGSLELGTALAVLLLAPEAYWPLRRVGAEFHAAAEGTATFAQVDELLGSVRAGTADAAGGVVGAAGAAGAGRLSEPTGVARRSVAGAVGTANWPVGLDGGIAIDSLTVAYPGSEGPVLDGFSAFIPTRGLAAVTGPSGCGKSTLLAALMGQLPIAAGSVTVVGASGSMPETGTATSTATVTATAVSAGSVELAQWQSLIAWVPQRPWIATASVRDNILLARPSATDAEVWGALDRVALADFVITLPNGLDEQLGEDGADLSAGQRARLALARAVVAERPLVLLDEPTAHLDPLTEHVIADTLVWLAERSAVVVVAHRQALVDLADRVIELPARSLPASPARPVRPAQPGRPNGPAQQTVPGRQVQPVHPPAPDRPDPHPGGADLPGLRLAAGATLGALAAGSGVALTATAGWLIARAAEHPPVLMLMVAIVGVRTFGLARPALRYAERLVSHDVALRLLAERRAAVYDALVPLTPGRLGRRRGDVLASVVDDVDALVDKHLRVRAPLFTYAAVSAIAVAFAGWTLPAAGLVTLLVVAVGGGLAYGVSHAGVAKAERAYVTARGRLAASVVHLIQGAPDLVMWQAAAREVDRADELGRDVARAAIRSARAVATGWASAVVVCGLGMVAMAAVGSPAMVAGTLSGPMLALLVLLPLALLEVVTPLADAGALQVRTVAADARLAELASTQPAVADPTEPVGLESADSRIVVDRVAAGWGREPAFRDLSFDVAPGGRIGIVGPSGCGKSTLAAVLLRFLDPSSGAVRLGTTDARDLRLEDVRRTVGLVDDDPHVFASSLRENIRLARPSASDEDLVEALRRAQLGTWLDGLRGGLDTMLGDGHAHVSGGERARIGLARAILADQPVLVLDEPTAHLDAGTAQAVAGDLLDAADGRSIVWITHGSTGLDRMDRLLDLGTSYEPAPIATTTHDVPPDVIPAGAHSDHNV